MNSTENFYVKCAVILAIIGLSGLAGCQQEDETTVIDPQIERSLPGEPPPMEPVAGVEPVEPRTEVERVVADPVPTSAEVFKATLMPMNTNFLVTSPSGEVELRVEGETVVIDVVAEGLPAGMMHLQHFHGFADGSAASCPGSDADMNNDGVIDVIEAESSAGITMVPFHDDPANMDIPSEAYPTADDQGAYRYNQSVSLNTLSAAFQEMFGDNELYLENRVVFIHGLPENAELPDSVQSIPGAPAQMTVPIACGELSRQ